MKFFSVHDSKAEAYLPPFLMKTAAEAIRAFETAAKDPKTQFNQYPGDYTLVEIAEFDERTCAITPREQPVILINAAALIIQ